MRLVNLFQRGSLALFIAAATLLVISPAASALEVYSVTANSGPTTGGNQVTIRGKGFLRQVTQHEEVVDIVGATSTSRGYFGNSLTPDSVVALTSFGKVYAWGNNRYGNVGTGTDCIELLSAAELATESHCYYSEPQDITGQFDGTVTKIYQFNIGGDSINAAVTDRGKAYVWGGMAGLFNGEFDSDNSYRPADYTAPTPIKDLDGYKVKGLLQLDHDSYAIGGFTDQSILIQLPEQSRTDDNRWININLSNQLGAQTIKDIDPYNGLILTNNGQLLAIAIPTEPDSVSALSVIDINAPDEVELVDLTSKIGDGVSFVSAGYGSLALTIGNDERLYALDIRHSHPAYSTVVNLSDKMQLPSVDKVVGRTRSGYGVLVHTTTDRIYEVQLIESSDIDYNQMKAHDITDDLSDDNIKLFNGHLSMTEHTDFIDYYSFVTSSQLDTVYSRAAILENRADINQLATTSTAKLPLTTRTVDQPAVSAITFGDLPATNFTVVDDQTILATVPAHAAGTVDVTLRDDEANSIVLSNSYTYTDNEAAGIGAPTSGFGGFITRNPLVVAAVGAVLAISLGVITHRRRSAAK